jgi:hypothetical protein
MIRNLIVHALELTADVVLQLADWIEPRPAPEYTLPLLPDGDPFEIVKVAYEQGTAIPSATLEEILANDAAIRQEWERKRDR